MLEISVKDKADDFMGWVLYDLCVVPKRVPPDSPVAPQWYELKDRKGDKVKGEVMLAVWWGTQADEAFPDQTTASVSVDEDPRAYTRSRLYFTPELWYLRVAVFEGQDLLPTPIDKTRSPAEIFVKATLGDQTMRTRTSINSVWSEEMMFVAAEPFEEYLSLSVIGNQVLGSCIIPLQYVDRRFDHETVMRSRWFNLQTDVTVEGEKMKLTRITTRIRLRIFLEGGYHVRYGHDQFSSDFRPTAKQLWRKSIGVLEVGILSASGLAPQDG